MISKEQFEAAKKVIRLYYEEQFPKDSFLEAIDSEYGRKEETSYYENPFFAILRNNVSVIFEENVSYKVNLINKFFGYDVKEGVEYLIIGLFICDTEKVQFKLYSDKITAIERDTTSTQFREYEPFISYVTTKLVPKLIKAVEFRLKKGVVFKDSVLKKCGLIVDKINLGGINEKEVNAKIVEFVADHEWGCVVENLTKTANEKELIFNFNLTEDDVAYRGNELKVSKNGIVTAKFHARWSRLTGLDSLIKSVETLVKSQKQEDKEEKEDKWNGMPAIKPKPESRPDKKHTFPSFLDEDEDEETLTPFKQKPIEKPKEPDPIKIVEDVVKENEPPVQFTEGDETPEKPIDDHAKKFLEDSQGQELF